MRVPHAGRHSAVADSGSPVRPRDLRLARSICSLAWFPALARWPDPDPLPSRCLGLILARTRSALARTPWRPVALTRRRARVDIRGKTEMRYGHPSASRRNQRPLVPATPSAAPTRPETGWRSRSNAIRQGDRRGRRRRRHQAPTILRGRYRYLDSQALIVACSRVPNLRRCVKLHGANPSRHRQGRRLMAKEAATPDDFRGILPILPRIVAQSRCTAAVHRSCGRGAAIARGSAADGLVATSSYHTAASQTMSHSDN
jgi:hypothetical protein